jgi:hypothetical protein
LYFKTSLLNKIRDPLRVNRAEWTRSWFFRSGSDLKSTYCPVKLTNSGHLSVYRRETV